MPTRVDACACARSRPPLDSSTCPACCTTQARPWPLLALGEPVRSLSTSGDGGDGDDGGDGGDGDGDVISSGAVVKRVVGGFEGRT